MKDALADKQGIYLEYIAGQDVNWYNTSKEQEFCIDGSKCIQRDNQTLCQRTKDKEVKTWSRP